MLPLWLRVFAGFPYFPIYLFIYLPILLVSPPFHVCVRVRGAFLHPSTRWSVAVKNPGTWYMKSVPAQY